VAERAGLGIHFGLITEVIVVIVVEWIVTVWIFIIRRSTAGRSGAVPIRLLWSIRKITRRSGRRRREFLDECGGGRFSYRPRRPTTSGEALKGFDNVRTTFTSRVGERGQNLCLSTGHSASENHEEYISV